MMSNFLKCHGDGQAYLSYKNISHKFTDEFQTVTFDLMVELYVRDQMGRKVLSDREFVQLKNTWQFIAEELGVLRSYPYRMECFPQAHPFTRDAAIEGKKRLGIAV